MEEELKEEIVDAIEEFSEDDEIMAHFGSEKDYMMLVRGEILEAKEEAREKGLKQGLREGRKEGIKEGLKQGISEGERKEKFEIAKNMLSLDISMDKIAKATNLSFEEIEKLSID